MNRLRFIFPAFLFVALFAGTALSQSTDLFTSEEGGFTIDLPKEGVTVDNTPEDEAGLGKGKRYSWLTLEDRVFIISYYLMDEGKVVSSKERKNLVAGFQQGFVKGFRRNKYTITEKPYSFKIYRGTEFRVGLPGGISVTRLFTTPTHMYVIQTTVRGKDRAKETTAVKSLDTFRLLGTNEKTRKTSNATTR